MIKHRLLFGSLMAAAFAGLMFLDGGLDGSLTLAAANRPIQASILCVLIILLAIPAQLELFHLIGKTGAVVFRPIVTAAAIFLATGWYWRQFFSNPLVFHLYYVLFVTAFSLFSLLLYQGLGFGPNGAIANCSAGFFAVFYLGFLAGFVLGIRIDFGLWQLLMFVFAVKSSDIGAYAIGSLLGNRKFSPKISPGKSWEGLAGAVVFALIVAVLFSYFCGIMNMWSAVIFGTCFGVLGQFADLAESMIKRDAGQKDASKTVPGFGGILDIIDSLLVTAPLAYLFFTLTAN
ncbi:MAG TPA: phosphatidate cytidylyltransferase [Planctomycetes bacterium]|nr:phosphatidate cytidylyltransferase [Planctomycetota bacterium]HIJ70095.1 phosphatidate cytidylyltransferase [Planctomycetota bacterium]